MVTKEDNAVVKQPLEIGHPGTFLEKAIKADVPLEKLEKYMDLYERWEKRQAEKQFNEAMSAFQTECPVIERKSKVAYKHKDGQGSTNYSYATLGEIAKTIKPALKKNGLSYKWKPENKDGQITVRCIISHIAGHSEVSEPMTAPADTSGKKNVIQQTGSTVTYLQRYTLIGALGISTADQDSDGQKAPENKPSKEALTPDHPKWSAAKEAIKIGTTSLTAIRKKYSLTEENSTLLCDGK